MTCPAAINKKPACGDCDTLKDYTISNVRLADSIKINSDNNPTTALEKETVCYSNIDDFFIA